MIKIHDNDGQHYCSQSMLNTHPKNQRNAIHQEQMRTQRLEGDEQL
jgi:hypothetical protein